jgi:prevent-host-death family protein
VLSSTPRPDARPAGLKNCTVLFMTELPLTEARRQFGSLVRRAASARERVTITDHGQPAAVIVGAQELADLEEALAIAEYRAAQASGDVHVVSQGEARARLGLPRR